MSGFLAQVCAEARERVAAAAGRVPIAEVRARAEATPAPPAFGAALQRDGVGIIAEVKRASPSRGPIAEIPDAAALASAYAAGGAAAVSVLTEPAHFRGSLDDLREVAAAVDVPVLRKDFIVDAYQVWEARAAGASAVLLIVAALDQQQLLSLLECAEAAGMTALLETHDEAEAARAGGAHEAAGITTPPVIGVNARNLTTLEVDPELFSVLRSAIPAGALAVAESGVRDAADVIRLAALGADAVLVGESVATSEKPSAAVAALVGAGRGAEVPR